MDDGMNSEPKDADSYMIESATEPESEEPERKLYYARTSKDELNELSSRLTPERKEYVTPTAEDALADLAKILGTDEDGERVLSDKAAQIWDLLYPYIASEDGPDYSEVNMEVLCADVLPKVWDLVLGMEDE